MNDDELNEETILRFENMLKTNKILFFDSEEFEDLILHYLDSGKLNLSKKALKLSSEYSISAEYSLETSSKSSKLLP